MGRWFGDASAGLHWTPETFWRASLKEFCLAVEGHNRMQRGGGPEPMTRAEYEELAKKYLRK